MAFKRWSTRWVCVFFLLCFVGVCAGLRSAENSGSGSSSSSSNEKEIWHSKLEYLKSLTTRVPAALGVTEELDSCEEVYSVFPCSTTFGGNLFLLVIYGYMLLKAAACLSGGSELLLTVLNPGIIGGLLLPILGALPDALLIMVSGMSASAADAQSEVLVGMGLLAGSNIMLLTALWGSVLLLGRNDLVTGRDGKLVAKDRTLENGWSLTKTGVTTDQQTRVASWIMIITVLPYLVAQTPVIFGWSKRTGLIFVLIGGVISLIGLASYCTYQVTFPWIQERWIYRARVKVHRSAALHKMSKISDENSWGSLLEEDGRTPNRKVLAKLFSHFDENNDNHLSRPELRGLITGLGIEHEGKIPEDSEVNTWLNEFDVSNDEKISEEEFVEGMVKWMHAVVSASTKKKPKQTSSSHGRSEGEAPANGHDESGPRLWGNSEEDQMSLTALLQDQNTEDDDEEGESAPPSKAQIISKAVALLVLGALIAGIVADPLVDAIGNFSTVTGISPFFISFVATPLATNSSEAISSLLFAMRRKKKNISMTYSQIYGGVTMNNTMCLAIFLAIVYFRGLTWDFSSEVLVILLATVVIGALASVRVTFPSWMAIIALLLYPISVALVAVLDYVYGWQ